MLFALALACGGPAASQVQERARAIERRLTVREVPQRFAPPDSFASPRDLSGLATATAVPAGGYLTASQLERGGRPRGERGALGRGERAVEVAVAGGGQLVGATAPGARVDVLVTTGVRQGAGRKFIALEDAELLGLRAAGTGAAAAEAPAEGAAARAGALATMRVSVRQAVFLTAAQTSPGRSVCSRARRAIASASAVRASRPPACDVSRSA